MALEDEKTVDAAGVEKTTGSVVLTITDDWDWTERGAHILALQAKINSYLGFIESGEILDTFPQAAYKPIIIEVISKWPLPNDAEQLINHIRSVCAEYGCGFRHQVFPEHRGGSFA